MLENLKKNEDKLFEEEKKKNLMKETLDKLESQLKKIEIENHKLKYSNEEEIKKRKEIENQLYEIKGLFKKINNNLLKF